MFTHLYSFHQVNLFGIATIMAEFHPGGGIKPYWRFDSSPFIRNSGGTYFQKRVEYLKIKGVASHTVITWCVDYMESAGMNKSCG